MPLIINGVTVPENVANALMVNGVSVTQIIANGVSIWNQSLFAGAWSGSSLSKGESTHTSGIATSGSGYYWRDDANGTGSWLYADSNGLATGSSRATYFTTTGFDTTPTTFTFYHNMGGVVGVVSFGKGVGFTGSSLRSSQGFTTSSGLMAYLINNIYGAWISLA